jgi:ABC-type glycerol-3-phosphate transport system substrate-binding protein
MLREDHTQPRPTDTKVISTWDLFKAGRLAMAMDGTWFFTDAKNIKNFRVGIAGVPSAKGKAYSSQFVDS